MAKKITILQHDLLPAGIQHTGIELTEAYLEVVAITWRFQPKPKGEAEVTVCMWASEASFRENRTPLAQCQYFIKNPSMNKSLVDQAWAVVEEKNLFNGMSLSGSKNV